jgi:hypothetical protein
MSKNAGSALREAGTAVWLDQLSRALLVEGRLQSLMGESALSGVTSNPTIFHKARDWRLGLRQPDRRAGPEHLSSEALYEHMAVRDSQIACEEYVMTGGPRLVPSPVSRLRHRHHSLTDPQTGVGWRRSAPSLRSRRRVKCTLQDRMNGK